MAVSKKIRFRSFALVHNTVLGFSLLAANFVGCTESELDPNNETTTDSDGLDTEGQDTDGIDMSDAVFAAERVLDIHIQLSPADWDALRLRGRDLGDVIEICNSGTTPAKIYNYYPAQVSIDGVLLDQIGVRKKGFLGSLSAVRPSLKLKFDLTVPLQHFMGMKRMTINNNFQDPAEMRQCLSYDIFRKAGLEAPRCNFARVSVNGVKLGVYSHVEPIKKPFLARNFANDDGNLYEGQLSDFFDPAIGTFEKKTNEAIAGTSDLVAVMQALQSPDETLLSALDSVIDLQQFIRFWAMESLIGHWDGYANNTNNFYIYNDTSDNRFRFIPWGTDGTWYDVSQSNFTLEGQPESVFANSLLSRRVYDHPEGRQRYLQTMADLLQNVWNEAELLTEVDRITALLGADVHAEQLQQIKTFIGARRQQINAELAVGGLEVPKSVEPDSCPTINGSIDANFQTTYGAPLEQSDFSQAGTATIELTLDNEKIEFSQQFSLGGPTSFIGDSRPGVALMGIRASDNKIIALFIFTETELFHPNQTLYTHGFSTGGFMFEIDPTAPQDMARPPIMGFIADGTLQFSQASSLPSSPVVGTLQAAMVDFGNAQYGANQNCSELSIDPQLASDFRETYHRLRTRIAAKRFSE